MVTTLKTFAGDSFNTVAATALVKAIENKHLIQFEFNGINCIVSNETDINLLYRDYSNSHKMNWKTIGPNCELVYSVEIIDELDKRNTKNKIAAELASQEYNLKQKNKKEALESKISDIDLELRDEDALRVWESKNKDSYGSAVISYALAWGKLMQYEISKGKELIDIMDITSHEADVDGITGFMYGAAVSVLASCWIHGEELRKLHNKKYNRETDGVINPAIITID